MAELRHYTSLRVGGPAKKFVDAHNEKEIVAAIEAAGDSPILIIGGGTNILVADGGFDGTVIRITNKSLEAEIDACSRDPELPACVAQHGAVQCRYSCTWPWDCGAGTE